MHLTLYSKIDGFKTIDGLNVPARFISAFFQWFIGYKQIPADQIDEIYFTSFKRSGEDSAHGRNLACDFVLKPAYLMPLFWSVIHRYSEGNIFLHVPKSDQSITNLHIHFDADPTYGINRKRIERRSQDDPDKSSFSVEQPPVAFGVFDKTKSEIYRAYFDSYTPKEFAFDPTLTWARFQRTDRGLAINSAKEYLTERITPEKKLTFSQTWTADDPRQVMVDDWDKWKRENLPSQSDVVGTVVKVALIGILFYAGYRVIKSGALEDLIKSRTLKKAVQKRIN
jgi:hypothetical protein